MQYVDSAVCVMRLTIVYSLRAIRWRTFATRARPRWLMIACVSTIPRWFLRRVWWLLIIVRKHQYGAHRRLLATAPPAEKEKRTEEEGCSLRTYTRKRHAVIEVNLLEPVAKLFNTSEASCTVSVIEVLVLIISLQLQRRRPPFYLVTQQRFLRILYLTRIVARRIATRGNLAVCQVTVNASKP